MVVSDGLATLSAPSAAAGQGRGARGWAYRPDIDALRGIAVLAVFIYHLNGAWLPGGFTGVDVFFVISGYVVTGSLLAHQQEPLGPRLAGFYLRRMRRLLPNLLCAVGITSIGIAFLVPPKETRGLFTAAVKALYGWSNNHFLQNSTNYFGLDASLNPLSHTWSLGVEEQFYLVFPLLLALLGAHRRRALPLLLGFLAASLLMSFWWTREAPMAAFFLMPSRFWELGGGAALLLGQRRGWLAGLEARLGARWLRLGGYGLLLLALICSSEKQGFPAPGALPAVLATLLLLQAGSSHSQLAGAMPQRFLPWRWLERSLVACGVLSYSLYLWHWPVLTFLRWTWGIDRIWLYLLAIGLSFGLAWLAYVLVEQPVRRRPLPGFWQLGLTLAAVGLTWNGIELLAYSYRGKLFLGSSADPVPDQEIVGKFQPIVPNTRFSVGNCVVDPSNKAAANSASQAFGSCYGLAGERKLYLVGDSHAQHLLPMLGAAADGFSVRAAFKNSCLVSTSLMIDYQRKKYTECSQFSREALDYIASNSRPGDVVLISTWLNRQLGLIDASGKRNDSLAWFNSRQIDLEKARGKYVIEMREYAVGLARKNAKLVLVVDVPPLARSPVACNSWNFKIRERCVPALTVSKEIHADTASLLSDISRGLPNVYIFDPAKYLFGNGNVSVVGASGKINYSDAHHLTVSASKGLALPFVKFAAKNNLSP